MILLRNWWRRRWSNLAAISPYADSGRKTRKWSIVIDGWFLTSDEEMEPPFDGNIKMFALVRRWWSASRCGGYA